MEYEKGRYDRTGTQIFIGISDKNIEYLYDYQSILNKFDIKTRVDEEYKSVICYGSLEDLLRLYQLSAFRGTDNWIKLLTAIKIRLESPIMKRYKRLLDIYKKPIITRRTMENLYDLTLRGANRFLEQLRKVGFIKIFKPRRGRIGAKYALSRKGIKTAKILEKWSNEFETYKIT